MNADTCVLDFETKSACSLKRSGAWRYSLHPSTDILCLVWRLPHWEPERTAVWHPAMLSIDLPERIEFDALAELFEWIAQGKSVEAHNVWFEFCIWRHIMVERYGWPEIPLESWRCSAAKAASHALPRGLEDAVDTLKLPVTKDLEGAKVMKKMTKPRRSRKKERETWAKQGVKPPRYLWHESKELLDRLIIYCQFDVLAEEGLSAAIPDLSPQELKVFQTDLRINLRGFQLSKKSVKVALRLLKQEALILNRELSVVTERKVRRATQRGRMLAWFQEQGLNIYDTQKQTIDDMLQLQVEMTPAARRGLDIVRALGRSSTSKYRAMKNWMDTDGTVHGGLLYHGATTGRWAGKGIQPHNFPKGTQKGVDVAEIWACIERENRDEITAAYRSVMEALSNALRGTITARKKQQLYVSDYSTIEVRVLLWLANDTDGLGLFYRNEDPYCDMASAIYDRPITKADGNERQLGKAAVLGCGYGMGASKFVVTAETYGVVIDEDFAQQVVDTYREKYQKVKQLWYNTEDVACEAVMTGRLVKQGRVSWVVQGNFLYCILPSGRRLAYPFPQLQEKQTPWGEWRNVLTYMEVDTYSHKWKRQHSYGAMLVENKTQAIARDFMAGAMVSMEQTDYQVVLTVHDEIVAEAPEGVGSIEDFESYVTHCPKWGTGCPIAAETWRGFRYHK